MKTHKDLDVYNLALDFVVDIYKHTAEFPKSEIYGLTNQIRRASVSIPSNISEGSARKGSKEFIQFLYIALGSNNEVSTQLVIAKRLNMLSEEEFKLLYHKSSDIGKMLSGLIRQQKSKL